MTDTNPRDLIKRLADIADALDGRKPLVSAQGQVMDGFTALDNFRALADEARAYLAQPEPEGPTDEPLGDLIDKWVQEAFRKKPYGCSHPIHTYVACKAFEHGRNHPARTALTQPELEAPTDVELQELLYYEFTTSTGHGERSDPIGFARAVLARWGSQPSTVAHSCPRWYDSTAPTGEP